MLTKKIWCPAIESEPEGLFNTKTCPDAPAQWFHEEPAAAAELYALEFGSGNETYSGEELEIHVIDEGGTLHRFQTETRRELVAHVTPLQ